MDWLTTAAVLCCHGKHCVEEKEEVFFTERNPQISSLDPISKYYADKAYDVQNKSVVFSSP
jgi:uncharacterized Fe-S cluster protein YjdI